MSVKDVIRFNYAMGNQPSMATHYEVFKQIKTSAALIMEECQELFDAANEEDMQEILDGCMDIKFLNTYLEHLLEAYGCKTKQAYAMVCDNNSGKITTSYTYAQTSKEYLESREDGEFYIDETLFEGERLYTVKRSSDNKVMKLKSHQRPELDTCIPEEFKL